jgi:hypothetical protein
MILNLNNWCGFLREASSHRETNFTLIVRDLKPNEKIALDEQTLYYQIWKYSKGSNNNNDYPWC